MAKRNLTLVIESAPLHCDGCAQWAHDVESGPYECRIFDKALAFDVDGRLIRCDDCLKAETGG